MLQQEVRDIQKALEHEWKVGAHFYKAPFLLTLLVTLYQLFLSLIQTIVFSRVKLK